MPLAKTNICCDIAVTQINYLSLNKSDNIEQIRGQSHEKDLVKVFILDDSKLGGFEVI
jgi:hypothetical protein